MIVISFYPGGGGNRYLRKLQGAEYKTTGITYDDTFKDQLFAYRYLTESVPPVSTEIVLTHCMDYERIESLLHPEQIFVIQTDLHKSLRREWVLNGHELYSQNYNEAHDNVIVELYNAIKTDAWPLCSNYQEFVILPDLYKNEVLVKLVDVPKKVESAWATITWHVNYYKTSNIGLATIVTDNEFMNVINNELDNYTNDIFDFCWQQYQQYGINAPIVDLYNQHIHEQATNM